MLNEDEDDVSDDDTKKYIQVRKPVDNYSSPLPSPEKKVNNIVKVQKFQHFSMTPNVHL